MSANDGGPAFPRAPEIIEHLNGGTEWYAEQDGMSLRDYFAAQALRFTLSTATDRDGAYDFNAAAIGAYQVADAMLEARKQ